MKELLLVYIPLTLILASCIGFLYMNAANTRKRKKRGGGTVKEREENSQVSYSRLVGLFEVLSKFPLTSKGANQLIDSFAGLGIYTIVEQRVETARLLLTSYVILITSVVMIYFITDNIVLQAGSVILALVFRRDYINKKIRAEKQATRIAVYRSMSALKNEYERTRSVPKSFKKIVTEEKAKRIFANVVSLFKAENPRAALSYFNTNNPDPILQRFADLCFNSFYHSVTISPITQLDTFITNMDIIMSDLQVEIDLHAKEKKKFYIAEKLPIVALLIAAVGPGFFTSRYPGMHYFYTSAIGYVGYIITILAIAGGYYLVTVLNDVDRPTDDRFDFEIKLFLKPSFKQFWERRIPKFNKGVEDLLSDSLSYLSPEQLKFRQVYTSILTGLLVFVITIVFVFVQQKSTIVNLGALPDEVFKKVEKTYDSPDDFAKKYVLDDDMNDKKSIIKALEEEGISDSPATNEIVAGILLKNKEAYANAQYKAWYLFLVFIAMVVGFNIPQVLLRRRKKLVDTEIQHEILVLYAVVVQMMYTPLKLRDYFRRFVYISKLYPKTHLDCYMYQFNNPQFIKDSANRMKNPLYFDFMEKLYSLRSDRTAPEVFREIERKREYFFTKVLDLREEKLKNNYTLLSAIVWLVFILAITFMIIIPLALFSYTGFNQYSDLF